jgi:serine phosphatase RsbU (regulator of sigma subunit)/anti-sigma regulatory factor (Ser/Thr protein kinase)/CHASE3 domain sensor protein
MRMHPRIRLQVLFVSAIPLAFLLLLLALALAVQHDTLDASTQAQRSAQIMASGEDLMKAITAANVAVTQYAQSRDSQLLQQYAAAKADASRNLRDLRAALNGQPLPQRVQGLRFAQNAQDAMTIIGRFLFYEREGQTARATQIDRSPATRRLAAQLDPSFTAFTDGEQRLAIRHFNAIRGRIGAFGLALILSCGAGLLLTLFVSARFGVNIGHRLERLAENARRLASGKFAPAIEGHDEITQLDLVYREMTARIQQEHRISSTLQRVLLPQDLPQIPGVRVDTAYVPAAAHTEVGGDWYDVFTLADGRICLSVGDVAGNGLHAATVMGTVRLAMRTASRIDANPGAVLAHVNRLLCADHPDVLVTTFIAMLDPRNGDLRYAIAGHPSPILAAPDGSVTFLEGRGFLLGADPAAEFEVFRSRLMPGSGLVLYTDGIVEVRRDFIGGLEQLCDAVRSQWLERSDNIAEGIQRQVFADVQPHDDSALLVAGIGIDGAGGTAQRRTWMFHARNAAEMHRVKSELLEALHGLAHDDADFPAVELIFGELVGNVARHTEGHTEVTLICFGSAAELEVRDRGEAFEPRPAPPDVFAEGGRGLFLVGACARSIRVDRTSEGNCVSVTLPITLREGERPLISDREVLLG